MRLTALPRRPTGETLLPLIDVVFFLVVFFMLTSRLSDPTPFDVTPPTAKDSVEADGEFSIYINAEGALARISSAGIVNDDAALVSLASERQAYCAEKDCNVVAPSLLIHADQNAPAKSLVMVLDKLGSIGFTDLHLMTEMP